MDDEFYTGTRSLLRLPGVGVATYWKLQQHFGSAVEALAAPDSQLARYLPAAAHAELAQWRRGTGKLAEELARESNYLAAHPQISLIGFDDPRYPALLRQIVAPPPLLYVQGDASRLALPQLALVGSRKPTRDGEANAFAFAKHLAQSGFAVTSGLALGVDAAAHQGALAASGVTLAVMGTGIDRIYPSQHRALAQAVVDGGGCLISEFPLGTGPHASHFPRRNRLISGLSLGVLVVEAALQSGSLITARYALEQNREVFALPGSIHNPQARGCHQLLREGAVLVEQTGDIIDHLGGLLGFKCQEADDLPAKPSTALPASSPQNLDLPALEAGLLAALDFDPLPLDLLLTRVDYPLADLLAGLIELEIKGLVNQGPMGYQKAGAAR